MKRVKKVFPFSKKKHQREAEQAKANYDKTFLAAIQPQGGIAFADKYVKKGDGYEAILHLYEYPTEGDVMWLEGIMTMQNVVVTCDIATMPKEDVVTSINKSLVEQETRYNSEKKGSAQRDAKNVYAQLDSLYEDISQMGEVIKIIVIRLFVRAQTAHELEQEVKKVVTELQTKGFKGQIYLNESEWEWQSLFSTYHDQQKYPNRREGKGLPALSLAAGLPFHFSELNDPKGSYLGTTFTGGNVIFDLFHKDKRRRYYNGVLVGSMGAGKSTTLKKIAYDNGARGNFIRGFDVTGEFATLVEALNGQMIALDGSQGMINPLQIYRVSDTGNAEKDEKLSFMQHLSKVATFYQHIAGLPAVDELEEFKKMIRSFYFSLGFSETHVTGLKNEEYPIFSDFLHYLKNELYEDVDKRIIRPELSLARATRLEKIELIIDNVVHTYGNLFNGITTLPTLTNEQVVFYSIRNLTNLEKNIFNAQMYSALTLIWDNLIQIGGPQLKAIYEDETLDIDDIIRFLVIIDESHRIVNPESMLTVSFLTDFAREARKYFGGILLASQSIRDYVPDHTNSSVVTKIRTLFELTQYKFIMQQDSNALDTIKTIFKGELSDSEMEQIPMFQQGDCLLSISGVDNFAMNVEVSEEELAIYRGGM